MTTVEVAHKPGVEPAPPTGPLVHLGVFAGLMALSYLFYGMILDNPFWHAEDYAILAILQDLVADPSLLYHLGSDTRHHPVPLALLAIQYRMFGLDSTGYYAVNLFVHGINAYLVYALVTVLLADRRIAVLSGVLFTVGVGSYGKAVMFMGGFENLVIALLYLSIINLYIRNDLREQGRVISWRYLAVVILFLATSYAKPTAFSLVMGLLAYKLFFRGERGYNRRVLEPNLVLLVLGAVAFWIVRQLTGVVDITQNIAGKNPWDFTMNFVLNMINYIVHMFFPIHMSRLVVTSNPLVRAIYAIAPIIRVVIGLFILSYGLFGFVFGNRTIRFFLCWTFISVLPYCAVEFPRDWLNIRYLYLVAVGFVFVMASGTVLSTDLLHRRRWRRFVPYAVPLFFVGLSAYISTHLDAKYERDGQSAVSQESLAELQKRASPPR